MLARRLAWILTLLCMAFIFYMSSRSIEASRLDSARLMAAINLVGQEDDALAIDDWNMFQLHNTVRKYAHIVIYAGLCVLYFISLYGYFGKISVTGGIAVLLTAFYGATDEIHQVFTHRGAAPKDVMIDTLGGLAGVIIVGIIFFVIEKNDAIKAFWSRIYDFEPQKYFVRIKQGK